MAHVAYALCHIAFAHAVAHGEIELSRDCCGIFTNHCVLFSLDSLQDFDKEISCHKIHSPGSGSHAHLPLHHQHQHHHPHHHSLHNHNSSNSNNNNNEDDMEPTLLSPAHSNHSAYDSKEHVKELEFYKNLAAKAASLANHHQQQQRESSSASPLPMQIDADADDDEAEAEEQAMRLRREEQAQAKAFAAHLNGTSEYISKAKRIKVNGGRGNCQVKCRRNKNKV